MSRKTMTPPAVAQHFDVIDTERRLSSSERIFHFFDAVSAGCQAACGTAGKHCGIRFVRIHCSRYAYRRNPWRQSSPCTIETFASLTEPSTCKCRCSYFTHFHNHSTKTLPRQAPRPFLPTRRPALFNPWQMRRQYIGRLERC